MPEYYNANLSFETKENRIKFKDAVKWIHLYSWDDEEYIVVEANPDILDKIFPDDDSDDYIFPCIPMHKASGSDLIGHQNQTIKQAFYKKYEDTICK